MGHDQGTDTGRQTSRWGWLLLGVGAVGPLAVGLLTVALSDTARGASYLSPWRLAVGVTLLLVGTAVTIPGVVRVLRSGLMGGSRGAPMQWSMPWSKGWSAHRRESARLRRRALGRGPTAAADLIRVREVARQISAQRSLALLYLGLLMSTVGRALLASDPGQMLLVVVPWVVLAAFGLFTVRNIDRAERFLSEHPAPAGSG